MLALQTTRPLAGGAGQAVPLHASTQLPVLQATPTSAARAMHLVQLAPQPFTVSLAMQAAPTLQKPAAQPKPQVPPAPVQLTTPLAGATQATVGAAGQTERHWLPM